MGCSRPETWRCLSPDISDRLALETQSKRSWLVQLALFFFFFSIAKFKEQNRGVGEKRRPYIELGGGRVKKGLKNFFDGGGSDQFGQISQFLKIK